MTEKINTRFRNLRRQIAFAEWLIEHEHLEQPIAEEHQDDTVVIQVSSLGGLSTLVAWHDCISQPTATISRNAGLDHVYVHGTVDGWQIKVKCCVRLRPALSEWIDRDDPHKRAPLPGDVLREAAAKAVAVAS